MAKKLSPSNMLKFGKTIRHFRSIRGMKQDDLAKKAGVSVSFLSQIENDRREPSAQLIRRIAEALGVPEEAFAWMAIEPPANATESELEAFELAKMIASKYVDQCL